MIAQVRGNAQHAEAQLQRDRRNQQRQRQVTRRSACARHRRRQTHDRDRQPRKRPSERRFRHPLGSHLPPARRCAGVAQAKAVGLAPRRWSSTRPAGRHQPAFGRIEMRQPMRRIGQRVSHDRCDQHPVEITRRQPLQARHDRRAAGFLAQRIPEIRFDAMPRHQRPRLKRGKANRRIGRTGRYPGKIVERLGPLDTARRRAQGPVIEQRCHQQHRRHPRQAERKLRPPAPCPEQHHRQRDGREHRVRAHQRGISQQRRHNDERPDGHARAFEPPPRNPTGRREHRAQHLCVLEHRRLPAKEQGQRADCEHRRRRTPPPQPRERCRDQAEPGPI
ncbi:hypothetical protein D9M73_96780 [compost metagenome]